MASISLPLMARRSAALNRPLSRTFSAWGAAVLMCVLAGCSTPPPKQVSIRPREQWTPEVANAWWAAQRWFVGCNYTPRTAINQLEMWQAGTFNPDVIEEELGLAQSLGFNSLRVFLHHLLWEEDSAGFLRRMETFLDIAERHRIHVVFVLLDGVWDPFPKAGPQREPKPHLHNSGWVQSPGVALLSDRARHDELKPYIQGVIGHFRDDPRVHAWDMFNEPDNMNRPAYEQFEPTNKLELATLLLKKTYSWARELGPIQPITAGVWLGDWGDPARLSPMETFMLEQSDIISFHHYGPLAEMQKRVDHLKRYERPMLCTEYMARPVGSTFDPIMGYLKSEKVGAYNWGFVSGKTQTIYPWDSWRRPYTQEPEVWFHDIFRADGSPYRSEEVDYIRKTTGRMP